MVESDDEDDKYGPTRIEVLDELAEGATSKEDFLKILTGISEICSTDDEAWERRAVHFVDVVEEFVRHDLVDMPKNQDWKSLSKLFLIGAFEN